jgi:dTDP-4-amino-4,6-dideoxygalactose transaminase
MTEKIPLLDLHAQFSSIERDIRNAIDRVLQSQHFILGPEVEALEAEVAKYTQAGYGIGVTSGSDALLMALMVLGIGPGDEVITTPHTFFATVGAISRVGAKAVFVDIEPRSFNLDPNRLEKAITPKTKAVIPVHLFGQTADMKPIMEICRKKDISVIEDAAQAIGSEYQGKKAGLFGDLACWSFFPSKNLGAMGDAGMITTQNEELARKLKVYRSHGSQPKYFHKYVGGNFRIDAMQAAILRAKLPHLDSWTEKRQQNAKAYDSLWKEVKLEDEVSPPWKRPGDRHIFNQYVIRIKNRDGLKKHLEQNGIATEIYYPQPMHLQACFADLNYRAGDFPEAEKAAADSLALPIYPELMNSQLKRVVETISNFYRK